MTAVIDALKYGGVSLGLLGNQVTRRNGVITVVGIGQGEEIAGGGCPARWYQ